MISKFNELFFSSISEFDFLTSWIFFVLIFNCLSNSLSFKLILFSKSLILVLDSLFIFFNSILPCSNSLLINLIASIDFRDSFKYLFSFLMSLISSEFLNVFLSSISSCSILLFALVFFSKIFSFPLLFR